MVSEEQGPKTRLLEATMAYVAQHGVSELTLRQLAAALGTSHRMLVYHFGSKDGLLVEVVREIERRQRLAVNELFSDQSLGVSELIRRSWNRFADPALWPQERLFFEVYGHAVQGRPHAIALLNDVVDAWLEPLATIARRDGLAGDDAAAEARLAVAVTRGLLLDLLATGDRAAADRAMERFILGYEARVSSSTPARAERRRDFKT
jgi:AcrR family transcriptional regulator